VSLRHRLLRLYTALHARYGPQDWWPARGRFEVAVGAVLTQHTAWMGVERAIDNLRAARRLGPRRLARLALPRLGRLIRPAGTWRLKARRLRALAVFFLARAGGRLDRLRGAPLETLRAQLLAVPGIGPETADAILLYALGRPVFVADAYTRRVLSRHRIVPADIGYEELRRVVEAGLPRDPALFNELHALLVAVAKSHCRARPRCEGCPLRFDLRGRRPRG
jgi:endonuclease-3 related protein